MSVAPDGDMQEQDLEATRYELSASQRNNLYNWLRDCAPYVPFALRFRGKLDRQALRSTIEELVRRHDSLRTYFVGRPSSELPQAVVASSPREAFAVVELADATPQQRSLAIARLLREPMNRSQPLLFRSWLLCAPAADNDEQDVVLLVKAAHLIADMWSNMILRREIIALYRAKRGVPASLPAAHSYAEYARAEHSHSEQRARNLTFWSRQMRLEEGVLERSSRGDTAFSSSDSGNVLRRYTFRLDSDTVSALRLTVRSLSVPVHAVTMAALFLTIFQRTGERSLIVSDVYAGRARAGAQESVGSFNLPVPVRVSVAQELSFGAFVERVQQATMFARLHATDFGQVAAIASRPGHVGFARLRRARFNFVPVTLHDHPSVDLGSLTVERFPTGYQSRSVSEILLWVYEREDGMDCELGMAEHTYSAADVVRTATQYAALLRAGTDDPSRPIAAVHTFEKATD